MIQIERLTFGPFQENMYLLVTEEGTCAIIDPGCSDQREREALKGFIESHALAPVALWLTHAHIDHVLGNDFVCRSYGLTPLAHPDEAPNMELALRSAEVYGIPYDPSPEPEFSLKHEQEVLVGEHGFEVRFCPGHSPGHVVFINHHQRFVIGGDVLFRESVGRVDLPGGNGPQLAHSIRTELYSLPDDFMVYPGHGPATTIGYEKENNPFVPATGSGLL